MNGPRNVLSALLLVALAAPAAAADVNLSFSQRDRLDAVPQQAPTDQPLFFHLNAPPHGARAADPILFTVDKGTNFRVWLDPATPPGTARKTDADTSLGVQISSDRNANEKDKILFSAIDHNGPNHLQMNAPGEQRFVSFDFKLDATYETPRNWLLHFQVWQCCNRVPPFTIHVVPNADNQKDVTLAFDVVDDSYSATNPTREGNEIYRLAVAKGVWNTMLIDMKPSPDGSPGQGHINMWLNGAKKFDWTGFWGYNPNPQTKTLPIAGIDLGIYRRRQTTQQTVYFDNVRVGTTMPPSAAPLH